MSTDNQPGIRRADGFTRRRLLKVGGLTTAAAAIGAIPAPFGSTVAHAADASAAEARGCYDAIVVGLGFAGAIAARELRAKGLNPLLLEARGRVGGRTWTDTFVNQPVEMGGQFVDESQPLITAELNRYGIATAHGLLPAHAVMPTPDGPAPFSLAELQTRQGALLEKLFEGSKTFFPDPYNPLARRDLVREVDGLSLRNRLDQLNLSAADESWINGITAGQSGGSSTYGSYTALAQWWSLAGWSTDTWYRAQSKRVSTGMSSVIRAILADARAEIRLNAPVASITDTGTSVRVVTTAGQAFTARTVVVAVPVNVWKTITFNPGLPSVHSTATQQGVGVANSRKLWLHVRGMTEAKVVSGAEGDPFMTVLSHSETPEGQLLMALNSKPAINVSNRAEIEAALRTVLPEARLIDYRAQDWGAERYSLGGWALRRPGQLLAQLPAIQRPHGRIAFATSDIASGWVGFVEGAIEAGFRAADQAAGIAGATRTASAQARRGLSTV
ncbi:MULTISPECIES: flavin monoamine oxidase family protein [Streptomyces]|uniref:flavin monoamine oxidase family protein n=1 Tax=Streptomyces TaxID=1883 RepID=UPI001CC24CA6|nr:NAD(P)/FAD-dependent oxidoreductase [Streptomyces venezuelae]